MCHRNSNFFGGIFYFQKTILKFPRYKLKTLNRIALLNLATLVILIPRLREKNLARMGELILSHIRVRSFAPPPKFLLSKNLGGSAQDDDSMSLLFKFCKLELILNFACPPFA
jgi:hypothetical protein